MNVASGIAALKSRLARIAANSRRLTHASTSDGDGPSRKEAIAQLEQQEREPASWFAELQSQLEALFARPKTARRRASEARGTEDETDIVQVDLIVKNESTLMLQQAVHHRKGCVFAHGMASPPLNFARKWASVRNP